MANSTGISARQLRFLGELKDVEALDGFYLAGGSAIGWRFEHRRSIDLDFFSVDSDVSLTPVVLELTARGSTVRSETDAMVGFDTPAGPIDVVRYPYRPLTKPKAGPGGFLVASEVDLAVMKLGAISRRGLRRDFWDLYVLLHEGEHPLASTLQAYARRYRASASDRYHVARALTYFDDARLIGLSAKTWEQIERYFREQSTQLVGP